MYVHTDAPLLGMAFFPGGKAWFTKETSEIGEYA